MLLSVPLKADGGKEQKSLSHLKKGFRIEEVLRAVSRVLGVKDEEILRKRSKYADGRKMLMYCLCIYCRSSASIAELARIVSVSRSGILIAKDRFEKMLESNKIMNRQLNRVEEFLGNA